MNATAKNGDTWSGERNGAWWIYTDSKGNLYESKEVPVFRISMNQATITTVNGKPSIIPIHYERTH